MNSTAKKKADFLFLILSALFISALVVTNLIANKFVEVNLGFKTFIISAGILPYPLTFLITDLLSEIYGRKKTNQVVIGGLFASVFVLFALWLGHSFPAIGSSPVNDEVYDVVFSKSWRVISSSMIAYLIAQFIDVRIYHFWKRLTGGKYLWLRNNGSTIVSQLLDTSLVVFVLFVGVLSFDTMIGYIKDGFLFKVLFALVDTPFLYFSVFFARKFIGLKKNEEVQEVTLIQRNRE